MKTLIFFGAALILAGFAQLDNPLRHVEDIEQHAQQWFDNSSTVRYTKIVRHQTLETKDGGKVCYRAIHPAFVDVVCLGWDKGKIVSLEDYRMVNHDL